MKKQKTIKLIKAILFLSIVMGITSCTDADLAKWGGFGDEFKIEMLNCDGTVARTWVSTGKVESETTSDGYYFNDKSTGKLIEITGNIVITKQ